MYEYQWKFIYAAIFENIKSLGMCDKIKRISKCRKWKMKFL